MNYERKILDKKGKDTGVREDYRGSIYIDHRVFFNSEKVITTLKRLADSKPTANTRKIA